MKKDKIETFLLLFATEVLKDVAVQTHTDWEKYLKPIIDKYVKEYEKRN